MSVLINELEIVPQPAGEGGAEVTEEPTGESREDAGRLTARDVTSIVRNREKRRARVWAH